MTRVLPELPITDALPALRAALAAGPSVVLEAPPGAGKSTLVPLALLEEPWLAGRRIVMLEPRRLAARAVAQRMASTLGEAPGETVGYRTRLDSRVGPRTRIEVVTEGILTRYLEADPLLERAGLVVFDEFHERSLNADLALALALDARRTLAAGFRILVMSATLDGERIAALLGAAPRVRAEGRAFPVAVHHARRPPEQLEREVSACLVRALGEHAGDALVFLPGAAEIRRVERTLAASALGADTRIVALYGELGSAAQDEALRPARPGTRKVVLATNIAETSLTLPGVRIVIDSGVARRARFDPVTGMSGLQTVRVSRASAEQRRGRAGRVAPGVCYRVYTEAQERALAPFTPAEILEADLAPLALETAAWGTPVAELPFLDAPPAAALAQARDLLTDLGAIDTAGTVTATGRRMVGLGAHPRLARMLLGGAEIGATRLACELAALLSERDVLKSAPGARDADLAERVRLLRRESTSASADAGGLARVRELARHWQRMLHGEGSGAVEQVGELLALAYPDRIAQRRGDGTRYLLASGRGATFTGPEALAREPLLVAAALDDAEREARILLAARITRGELDTVLGARMVAREVITWDGRERAVRARTETRLGALVLDEAPLAEADPARVRSAMLEGIAELGLAALPWTREALRLRERIAFLHRLLPDDERFPDLSDEALAATTEQWLGAWLAGITRADHLARLDLVAVLRQWLGAAAGELERLAPSHLRVPSGSSLAIDYSGAAPELAVRLQEVFGLATGPTVAAGRVPVVLKLLSPAGRPVQVTRDLASFWARGYAEVRRELKGRYPKHHWPEDPLGAAPTARARPPARR